MTRSGEEKRYYELIGEQHNMELIQRLAKYPEFDGTDLASRPNEYI